MGEEIKLHGFWASPFVSRVKWALKLKGIEYEYEEENLPTSKSSSLLKYNPVHKKVPVLVHNGKGICESMVIVEYIDEAWPENYPLLPTDPYERATARFWVSFFGDKAVSLFKLLGTTGEEHENGKKECLEALKTIEEQAPLGDKKFFGGEAIGFLDITFGPIALWWGVVGEAIGIHNLLDGEKFPRLYSWATRFNEEPVIKENLPDPEKMLAVFKMRREVVLASA